MLMRNCFAHSSVMYRTLEARSVGGYAPVKISYCPSGLNDYDLWLKLGKIGKMANLPFYGLCYRTEKKGKVFESALEELRLIGRYKHDYPHYWKAVWVRCIQAPCLFLLKTIKGMVSGI